MTRLALVGIGEIGSRIGRHLVRAGYEVRGYDSRPQALVRAAADGVAPAGSVREACAGAALVITCVSDGAALRQVVEGPDGILSCVSPGLCVLDTTSAEPWISAALADRLAEHGCGFLDAPVSGGVPAAEAARMNFMIGGETGLLERWRSILLVLGRDIRHVGPVGAGHAVKALNMLALAGNMLVTLEAVAIALALGQPASRTIEALCERGAGSYACRVHFPKFILPGSYDSGFGFDLMLKDLSIGVEVMRRAGIAAAMAETVGIMYRAAAPTLAGLDNTRIAEGMLRAWPAGGASRPEDGCFEDLTALVRLSQRIIAAEILAAANEGGRDPRLVAEVLCAGSGESDEFAFYLRTPSGGSGQVPVFDPSRLYPRAADAMGLAHRNAVPVFLGGVALAAGAAALARTASGAGSGSACRPHGACRR